MLKILPGVIDTSAREAPGWGACRTCQHQRPRLVQLLVRRRHQQGHRVEQRQLRRAGTRLDRRSAGPGVELPGRVRPQFGRDDFRRHRAAAPRTSTAPRRSTSATTIGTETNSRAGSSAALRRHRAVRAAALHVRQHGVDVGRSGARPGHGVQQGPEQAVLLLVAGHSVAHGPGRSATQRRMPTALERAGDFSQTFDSQNRMIIHPRPERSRATCNSITGGPGVLPGEQDSGQPHQSDGQALLNLFPLPNASDPTGSQPVQLHLPDGAGLAAQRPGAAHGLEHRPGHDVLRAPAVRLRRTRAARRVPRLDRGAGWPQQPSKYEIDTVSYVNTLLHTFNPTTFARVHGRRELVATSWSATCRPGCEGHQRSRVVLPGWASTSRRPTPTT